MKNKYIYGAFGKFEPANSDFWEREMPFLETEIFRALVNFLGKSASTLQRYSWFWDVFWAFILWRMVYHLMLILGNNQMKRSLADGWQKNFI